jgi:hypothetical protein
MDMLLTPKRTEFQSDASMADRSDRREWDPPVQQHTNHHDPKTAFMASSPNTKIRIIPQSTASFLSPSRIGIPNSSETSLSMTSPALSTFGCSTSLMCSELSFTKEEQIAFESLSNSIDNHHRTYLNCLDRSFGNPAMHDDEEFFLSCGEGNYSFTARGMGHLTNRSSKRKRRSTNEMDQNGQKHGRRTL